MNSIFMPNQQEVENLEEEYAAELAVQQAVFGIERQIQEIESKSRRYTKPSLFKYGLLMFFAILADIVIILSYLLAGTGFILGILFASPFIVPIIFISWFTDTNVKSAQEHPQKVEQAIKSVQTNIIQTTRISLRTAQYLRKVPGMRRVSRAIPRALVKIRRVARRSPTGRILIGAGGNAIPGINLVPWQVVSIIFAYTAEKQTLKEARLAGLEAVQQLRMEEEALTT